MNHWIRSYFCTLVAAVLATACSITQIPVTERITVHDNPSSVILHTPVVIELDHAKPVRLRAKSSWNRIGEIPQGTVYSTADQVVVVESFNTRQAYIVVNEGRVVGYFLPVENSFVKVAPVEIMFIDQGN
ncbi:MAG: hypothetical protein WD397_16355 [Wenzhouxiangellaceae bacterium]